MADGTRQVDGVEGEMVGGGLVTRCLPKRRNERQMAGEEPAEEEDDGCLDDQLEQAIADEVARAESKDAEQGEHKKRVNEIGQRFRGVVDLNDPAEVHVMVYGSFEDVRRLNDPFAPAGGDEDPERCRIECDEESECIVRADGGE